jgi:hypothetical protein
LDWLSALGPAIAVILTALTIYVKHVLDRQREERNSSKEFHAREIDRRRDALQTAISACTELNLVLVQIHDYLRDAEERAGLPEHVQNSLHAEIYLPKIKEAMLLKSELVRACIRYGPFPPHVQSKYPDLAALGHISIAMIFQLNEHGFARNLQEATFSFLHSLRQLHDIEDQALRRVFEARPSPLSSVALRDPWPNVSADGSLTEVSQPKT